jgi:hypothetical protein
MTSSTETHTRRTGRLTQKVPLTRLHGETTKARAQGRINKDRTNMANGDKDSKKGTKSFPRPAAPVLVPLGDIFFNVEWNSREASRYTLADDFSGTFAEWANGLAANGQNTPIDVFPNPWRSKEHPQPYAAATGFRRGKAIAMAVESLAKENEAAGHGKGRQPRNAVEAGQVSAYFHEHMTETEATVLNAVENLDRVGLASADMALAVWRVRTAMPDASQQALADALGLSQAYVGQLLKIKETVMPDICTAWRQCDKPHALNEGRSYIMLSVDDMTEIGKVDQGPKQIEAYRAKFLGKKGGGAGRGNWIEGAKKTASEIGAMIGNLHRLGHINAEEIEWNGALFGEGNETPPVGVKWHKDVSEKSESGGITDKAKECRAVLVNAAVSAYTAAVTTKTDEQIKAEAAAAANGGQTATPSN